MKPGIVIITIFALLIAGFGAFLAKDRIEVFTNASPYAATVVDCDWNRYRRVSSTGGGFYTAAIALQPFSNDALASASTCSEQNKLTTSASHRLEAHMTFDTPLVVATSMFWHYSRGFGVHHCKLTLCLAVILGLIRM